jgi:Spy/CpxP family protein refolding chaperone
MRKTLLPLALALAMAGSWAVASAKDDHDGPRGPRMEIMLDHLLDDVDATDAQRTQIEAIADKYKPQMKSLHEQLHALHKQMHDEMAGVLTEEQRQKLGDHEEEFMIRRHRHHQEG